MKQVIIICMASLVPYFSFSQDYDSIPPYQKDSIAPAFSILQTDSTWFNKQALPEHTPVVIVYFSPTCHHCQLAAHEFSEKMKKMKDIFFVWLSYYSVPELKTFDEEYHLTKFKNVRLGRDTKYYIAPFYKIRYTPFMAVYGKDGKLLATYEQGTDPKTIMEVIERK